jgi:hypothetical protein
VTKALAKTVRERKALERKRAAELLYSREDFQLFLDRATISQKAGVFPQDLNRLVLKELVDNSLDAGATSVTISRDQSENWIIQDDGSGIEPSLVPKLFCVNRSLVSSKLKRLTRRGMLGNGLRVVMGAAALSGQPVIVETRSQRFTLSTNLANGNTVVSSNEPIPPQPGTRVAIYLAGSSPFDADLARTSIRLAPLGTSYSGPSSPWWYGPGDLHRLFANVANPRATVSDVARDLGLEFADRRIARNITKDEAAKLLNLWSSHSQPIEPAALGRIGPGLSGWPGYAIELNTLTTQSGAQLPYVVEAWADCQPAPLKGQSSAELELIVNRSRSLAFFQLAFDSSHIFLGGCDLRRTIERPGAGIYTLLLSVITPHLQLAGDGKTPVLRPFGSSITHVIKTAAASAYRKMARPRKKMSIKEAAWLVLPEAYQLASGNGQYPANARQVMYAARPRILELTGKSELNDAYFTQHLLPDYLETHPGLTDDWDVVFDQRGNLVEPHTGREVSLGTLGVRNYLATKPQLGPAFELQCDRLFPTTGPRNRFASLLFIEKEGFNPLLESAQIAERFDLAIMSTKGMSTTAARRLIDQLSPDLEKVLVLHDFDRSGFSIFGTLATSNRRYRFNHEVPIIDLGLRLTDVEERELISEPVKSEGDWEKRAETLRAHGATRAEIDFLEEERVELNAMSAPVFIAFLEQKLRAHGVSKVLPDNPTIETHARRIFAQHCAQEILAQEETAIQERASAHPLPLELRTQIALLLESRPELSWDEAAREIIL